MYVVRVTVDGGRPKVLARVATWGEGERVFERAVRDAVHRQGGNIARLIRHADRDAYWATVDTASKRYRFALSPDGASRRRYPMPGRALRLDPQHGTVLEDVTILAYDPARRTYRIRYADGVTVTSHPDYVLRGARGAAGADRRRGASHAARRGGHATTPHRHAHGRAR